MSEYAIRAHSIYEAMRRKVEHHREFLILMEMIPMLVGIYTIATGGGESIFTPNTWGTILTDIEAVKLGQINVLCCAMVLIGLIRPIHWRMLVAGSSLQVVHFGFIAYSCLYSGGDIAVGIYAIIAFTLPHLALAVAGFRYATRR